MDTLLYILISLVLKSVFIYVYPRTDAELYSRKYQKQIIKLTSAGRFLNWLFTEVKLTTTVYREHEYSIVTASTTTSETLLPIYRVFHFSIGAVYWAAAWFLFYHFFAAGESGEFFLIDVIAGIIWAYYWMLFERLYYTLSGETKEMYEFEINNTDVYWLRRIWFSGKWIFTRRFSGWKFDLSALTGLIGMYSTSFIYFFNL